MSRNGSGTYTLPAGNPVVTGTTISTTWANSTLTDIANTLTASVASDGQTPMTGSLNMASNKIVSVTDPTNPQDAATKAYVDLTQSASGITGGTINNTSIGATTPSTGAFTTLTASGATTLSSTLGVTGVSTFAAGTVSLPAITTAGDTNTGIFFPAADTIAFTKGGAEAMRISSTGKVLINTTTVPTNSFLYVNGAIGQNIDSSVAADNNNKSGTYLQGNNIIISHDNTEPTGFFHTFQYGGATAGYIQGISAGAGVQYISVSDYRLKENIALMTGALDTVAKLKPCTYTWKANGEKADGFIAHELAEFCPQAVTGEKDAVDAEGKPVYQGIDTSFLVATLTAAIQEQQALITQLQADVAALKSK